MTTQAIDATIFASSHPDIAKRTSISSLIISCLMLLAGILAFAATFEMEDHSSTKYGIDGFGIRIVFGWHFSHFLEVKRSSLRSYREYN